MLKILLIGAALPAALTIAADAVPDPSSPPHSAGQAETRRELRQKRQEIAEQIAAITDRQAPSGKPTSDADDEQLALLRSIDAAEFHHQSLLEQQGQLEAELAGADQRLARLDEFAPDEPKPYSFLLLEGLKDQLAEEQREEAALKTDIKSAEQLLAAAHGELDKAAQRRRAASGTGQPKRDGFAGSIAAVQPADGGATDKAAIDGAPAGKAAAGKVPAGGAAAGRHTDEKQAADAPGSGARQPGLQLAVTLAREKVALARTNVEVARLRLAASTARQKQLAKKIAVVEKDTEFSAQDRDAELGRLAVLEADLDHRRIAAETWFQGLESQSKSGQTATPGAVPQTAERPELRAAGELYNATLLLLDQQREQLVAERDLWRDRYQLAQGKVSAEEANRWLKTVDDFLAGLDDWSKAWEHRFNALSDEPIDAPDRSDAARRPAAAEDAPAGAFRDFASAYVAARREARHTRLGLERFRGDLKTQLARVSSSRAKIATWLSSIWSWEVLSDDKDAVTLGKLAILLSYILAGLLLAYVASWLIGGRLLRRLGWHRGKAAALKSILFYALCLFFGTVAFRALHVPLGAFAFLGGAAAIAVGFGSQDIMNNFMSGIILLTEQPIRVGDIIELSEVQGQVTYIGLRSTRLLTEANHELIVANKTLLDEQVKNLTLSDRLVQMTVTIDLDRNLPVAATKRQMLELTFSHPLVIKTNRPVVLLTEVDSYALRFQVLFWIEHQSFLKCAIVQSEVMEMITDAFPSTDSETSSPASDAALDADPDADPDADAEPPAAAVPKHAPDDHPAETADRNGSGGEKRAPLPSPPGCSTELSREISATIRKMGRAAIKKEIRRAGLG